MDLNGIQTALKEQGLDGWLFYDFANRDPIAYSVLGLDFNRHTSRRWYYLIPADGEPRRLAHGVEPTRLDDLPGSKTYYRSWKELDRELPKLLDGMSTVAMNYSPRNEIPYVSMVDAGTLEHVRDVGVKVVSSADLVQKFESLIDDAGYQSHLAAGEVMHKIKNEAFAEVERCVKEGTGATEYDIQQFMMKRFEEEGLTPDHDAPIVGVNEHPADPHFFPNPANTHVIKKGDMLLIDLWAKFKQPGSIFYDITWMGFVGQNPPEKFVRAWEAVRDARDAAVDFIRDRFAKGEACYGWEVDDVCRQVVIDRGFGDKFVHRTGHSIGEACHGNGVNIDNLETKDSRQLLPGACFSIEPGIYIEGEMGVRTEVDVFIRPGNDVVVTGESQLNLILMDV